MLVKQLRLFGSITVLNLGEVSQISRNTVRETLGNINAYQLGNKFLALVSKRVVPTLFEEVD